MKTADTIYDILNIFVEGILNNSRGGHFLLFMKMIHNFLLESGEIYFNHQFDLLNIQTIY